MSRLSQYESVTQIPTCSHHALPHAEASTGRGQKISLTLIILLINIIIFINEHSVSHLTIADVTLLMQELAPGTITPLTGGVFEMACLVDEPEPPLSSHQRIILENFDPLMPEGVHSASFMLRGTPLRGYRGKKTSAPVALIAGTSTWKMLTGSSKPDYKDPSGQRYGHAASVQAIQNKSWGGMVMLDGPEAIRERVIKLLTR